MKTAFLEGSDINTTYWSDVFILNKDLFGFYIVVAFVFSLRLAFSAHRKGRSALAFFAMGLLLTPIIGFIILGVKGANREVLHKRKVKKEEAEMRKATLHYAGKDEYGEDKFEWILADGTRFAWENGVLVLKSEQKKKIVYDDGY